MTSSNVTASIPNCSRNQSTHYFNVNGRLASVVDVAAGGEGVDAKISVDNDGDGGDTDTAEEACAIAADFKVCTLALSERKAPESFSASCNA